MSKRKFKETFKKGEFEPNNERYLIGIDPGADTGFAIWDQKDKILLQVCTFKMYKAQKTVLFCREELSSIIVFIEDARLRKWYGKGDTSVKLQGVGSVKRDSMLWEEFCEYEKIPFKLIAPKSQKGKTKVEEEEFKLYSGWKKRTSEHARDAAMLVFGRGRY
ncbi:hypothetical protein LEP1GSC126_0074 [Leptospira kirschneri str. 200801774]|uniref:hypothetical protein n=1 Tax=Leptospira kirschneri TaxID=29507 RepID=UPI0002BE2BA0|nr:hypothetical protein [Leptospira kirschneri]EMO78574.1 hypothetical protein LEP1GSC126_0074 [Leptospira kirschneri str. 200801774]